MELRYLEPTLKGVTKQQDTKVFSFVATSDTTDRDRDVVLPDGGDFSNLSKNPVFLWAHNYREFPIGKIVNLKADKKAVTIDVVFAQTEEGKKAEYLYENGFLNAVSIGFIPRKVVQVPDDVTTIEVEVNGKKRKVNLSKYNPRPRFIIPEWELLEVSAVTVPANPEALILRTVKSLAAHYGIEDASLVADELTKDLQSLLNKAKEEIELLAKGAVPSHSTPIDFELNWDKTRARANLARWASSDGTGDKDTINWTKYAKGFAWFDSQKKENFTAYKLPHHDIVNGRFVAVWRGVTAAMAALLGARGGVNIPQSDKKAVWNHLARHYRDADREPPPLNRSYTEEELKAIEEDRWPLEEPKQAEPVDKKTAPEPNLVTLVEEKMNELKQVLEEIEASVSVKLSILESVIEEKLGSAKQSAPEPASEDKDFDQVFAKAWDILSKVKN